MSNLFQSSRVNLALLHDEPRGLWWKVPAAKELGSRTSFHFSHS